MVETKGIKVVTTQSTHVTWHIRLREVLHNSLDIYIHNIVVKKKEIS